MLNNGALASLALFEISGDRQASTRHAVAGKGRQPQSHGFPGLGERLAPNACGRRSRIWPAQAQSPRAADVRTIGALYFLANDRRAWTKSAAAPASTRGSARASTISTVNVLAPKNLGEQRLGPGGLRFSPRPRGARTPGAQVAASKPESRRSTPRCSSSISTRMRTSARRKWGQDRAGRRPR